LLWSGLRKQTEQTVAAATHAFAGFRGYVAIDEASGAATADRLAAAIATWRDALCAQYRELNHK
jgi:hypothetical protein